MKGLGYTEDQFVRFTGKQRQDILDNNIREENFVTEQPTRPSMPVPGPAPDVTPSTKKSDKLVPEKLEPKPKEVKPEVAEKTTFEKGSTENKLIGYRVMRYDPNTGKAISGADGRQSILPKKGEDISYGGGFFLTNDPQYATDYYAVHDNNISVSYTHLTLPTKCSV